MLNAVIIDFYLNHTKKGILKLEEKKIINIKYWLTAPGYNTEKNMFDTNEINKTYLDIKIPDDIYEEIRKGIYFFMNIHSRWIEAGEIADYVHDFNIFIKYWYKIFSENDIHILIMGNAPHAGLPYVAYLVAKALNIKIIITEQIYQLKNRFICCKSLDRMGYRDYNFKINSDWQYIENKFEKNLFYMKNLTPLLESKDRSIYQLITKNFFTNLSNKYKKEQSIFIYFILEKIGFKLIRIYLSKWFNKHRNDLCENFDKNKIYVYFPLHFQPEMTTDTLGGIYEDQLLAVERLSSILPKDWIIYIKENPKQTYYKRSKKFFDRIRTIKKVHIVNPDTNTYDLIKHSKFVATITGTVGWEAITGGKNVLVFASAWYRTLPGVFEYSNKFDINDILNYKIEHAKFEVEFNEFYRTTLLPGVVAGGDVYEFNPKFEVDKNNDEIFNSLKLAIENY